MGQEQKVKTNTSFVISRDLKFLFHLQVYFRPFVMDYYESRRHETSETAKEENVLAVGDVDFLATANY
jgi:hypothetical protein